MKSEAEEQTAITKLRRRIEDYLRKTHVGNLIKVAKVLGLEVNKDLVDKYG